MGNVSNILTKVHANSDNNNTYIIYILWISKVLLILRTRKLVITKKKRFLLYYNIIEQTIYLQTVFVEVRILIVNLICFETL